MTSNGQFLNVASRNLAVVLPKRGFHIGDETRNRDFPDDRDNLPLRIRKGDKTRLAWPLLDGMAGNQPVSGYVAVLSTVVWLVRFT